MIAVRRTIEQFLTRVLRSRVGIALALAVVVFGIIGTTRLVAGAEEPGNGLSNRPEQPITTVHPTVGDDGLIDTRSPTPVTRPGAAAPEQVAAQFVTAWRGEPGMTAERWHAGLRPLATPVLAEQLVDVDPADVPTGEVAGTPTVRARSETVVEARVPFDTGQLRLELVAPDGQWRVDAVDWEQK
ncbi:hypothetical protein [Salinispora fenicalii]|uniref:hypothetical protein n=1 Tax=Salinispora fenicalii TaxID=1137263 RepID=UPI000487F005|nr:hypothetical protein [Salinispora fenicalii]